jgi:Tc5 transposase DNA-binding domain
LNPNNESQGPTKKKKGKFPDIERALANWAKNEQIKGEPLNDSRLQEQLRKIAVTVGNPESRSELVSSAWLEEFKQTYNIFDTKGHSNFHESDGIHVDSNTTSLLETPNSYTPISSHSGELALPPTWSNQNYDGFGTHRSDDTEGFLKSEGQDESTPRMTDRSAATSVSYSAIEKSPTAINSRQMIKRNKSVPDIHSAKSTSMQPPPVPPLPRSENTSPVNLSSPTPDDARRALNLVGRFFQSQPADFLEPDEYAVFGKLMAMLFFHPSWRD